MSSAMLNLLTLRGGPQDFPYDRRLSAVLGIAAIASLTLCASVIRPPAFALLASTATVGGTALAAHAVLRIRALDNRFLQTWHSLLATITVLNLFMLWPLAQVGPAFVKAIEAAEKTGVTTVPDDVPAGPVLILAFLNLWTIAVWGNVFRHALDVSIGRGMFVALLVILSIKVFVNLMVLPFDPS